MKMLKIKLLEIFAWMGKSIAIKVVQRSGANREEKSLHYTAEVAQFLDLNKPRSNKYGRKNCHVRGHPTTIFGKKIFSYVNTHSIVDAFVVRLLRGL